MTSIPNFPERGSRCHRRGGRGFPLSEEGHLWEAIRYVELNPVRAGLARHAGDWVWSSAAAHLGGADPSGLLDFAWWRERWQATRWEEVLKTGVRDAAWAERFREATRTGRPFGGHAFSHGSRSRLAGRL